jgi:hypothetical protein
VLAGNDAATTRDLAARGGLCGELRRTAENCGDRTADTWPRTPSPLRRGPLGAPFPAASRSVQANRLDAREPSKWANFAAATLPAGGGGSLREGSGHAAGDLATASARARRLGRRPAPARDAGRPSPARAAASPMLAAWWQSARQNAPRSSTQCSPSTPAQPLPAKARAVRFVPPARRAPAARRTHSSATPAAALATPDRLSARVPRASAAILRPLRRQRVRGANSGGKRSIASRGSDGLVH